MNDKIFIRDLRLRAIIGFNDWERENKQDLVLNITIHTSFKEAGISDLVDDTVNYRTIIKHIISLTEASTYHLIESLATHIAKDLITLFKLKKVEIQIDKPHALRFSDSVAIALTRTKHDF